MINVSFSCHGLILDPGDAAVHSKLLSQQPEPVLAASPAPLLAAIPTALRFAHAAVCQQGERWMLCFTNSSPERDSSASWPREMLSQPHLQPQPSTISTCSGAQFSPPAGKETLAAATWALAAAAEG